MVGRASFYTFRIFDSIILLSHLLSPLPTHRFQPAPIAATASDGLTAPPSPLIATTASDAWTEAVPVVATTHSASRILGCQRVGLLLPSCLLQQLDQIV